MQLRLSRVDYEKMVAHVQAQWPEEACGLLAGPEGQVRQVYLVENIRHSPVAYEMHGLEQVQAMVEMEAQGWDLLAIFHSHPHGPPFPSETDIELAFYPEAVYIIFALDEPGQWQARGFQIENGAVRPVPLEVAV